MPIPIIAYELTLIINIRTRNHQDKPRNDHLVWISSQHALASFKFRRFTTWWYFMVLNLMDFHPFNTNALKQFHACCEPWSNLMEVRIPHQNSHKYAPSHASAAGVQESKKSFAHFSFGHPKHHEVRYEFGLPKQTYPSNTLKFQLRRYCPSKSRGFTRPSLDPEDWEVYRSMRWL